MPGRVWPYSRTCTDPYNSPYDVSFTVLLPPCAAFRPRSSTMWCAAQRNDVPSSVDEAMDNALESMKQLKRLLLDKSQSSKNREKFNELKKEMAVVSSYYSPSMQPDGCIGAATSTNHQEDPFDLKLLRPPADLLLQTGGGEGGPTVLLTRVPVRTRALFRSEIAHTNRRTKIHDDR